MQGVLSRRELLNRARGGFLGTALSYLLAQDGILADSQETSRPVTRYHHPPRAHSCIVLFMPGGFSHVDTFDPKPELTRRHGQRSEHPREAATAWLAPLPPIPT